MAVFPGVKRSVTSLEPEARARLFSWNRQFGDSTYEDDSPCLSDLVHDFLEAEGEGLGCSYDSEFLRDLEEDSCATAITSASANEILSLVSRCPGVDPYLNLLCSHVYSASEAYSGLRRNGGIFRRKVMSYLRELGHDAAICNTEWYSSASGGAIAGNHEFIDVILQRPGMSQRSVRYFVDLDFASEFEIARATPEYVLVAEALPIVFVGKGKDLKRVVRLACDAAQRSLLNKGLSVPPWRRYHYMQNKWFGPFKRSTTPAQTAHAISVIDCRSVDFDCHSFRPTR